jgi:hypothetical protein
MKNEDRVLCQTPTPGKQGTRIPQWKFEALRGAILEVLPRNGTGLEFRELPALVERALPDQDRKRIGSIPWHTVTVKLHMEVMGDIERIPGAIPQRLRRVT